MAKLCPKGKAAAKRKFKVYPSAYANMYASGVCSGKIKPTVNTTKLGTAKSKLAIAQQKLKASGAKLKQTQFEIKNKQPITFKSSNKKSESNTEKYKRIQKDNSKVIGKMVKKAFDAGKGK